MREKMKILFLRERQANIFEYEKGLDRATLLNTN